MLNLAPGIWSIKTAFDWDLINKFKSLADSYQAEESVVEADSAEEAVAESESPEAEAEQANEEGAEESTEE